jgi:hypothetical protein
MNIGEELQRLQHLINDLMKQNKQLKDQLDNFHSTYGCESNVKSYAHVTTMGCSSVGNDDIL